MVHCPAVSLAPLRRHGFALVLILGYAASLALALVPFRPPALVVLAVVLGLGTTLPLLALHEAAATAVGRRAALLAGGVALGTWLASGLLLTRGVLPWTVLMPVSTAALLALGGVVGFWLGGEIERPGHLIPVGVVAALADLFSVAAGPTRRMTEAAVAHTTETAEHLARGAAPPPPPLVKLLILQWPEPGAGGLAMVIGFGDLAFAALLFAASRRFGLAPGRAFALVLGGLLLAMAAALGLGQPVPALPFVAVVFVLGFVRHLPLTRREAWITVAAAVLLGLALVVTRAASGTR
jgi:hypothetical protein